MRRVTDLAMVILAAVLLGMTILSPLVERLSIILNNGGMMAAMGLWDPPHRGHGPWMHPLNLVVFALVCAFATKFFTSDAWHDLTGMQGESQFFAIPAAALFMSCAGVFACMAARYHAWYF